MSINEVYGEFRKIYFIVCFDHCSSIRDRLWKDTDGAHYGGHCPVAQGLCDCSSQLERFVDVC